MPQVYVHFHPVLIDIPQKVYDALSSERDVELARVVCAEIAAKEIASIRPENQNSMAVMMLEQISKA